MNDEKTLSEMLAEGFEAEQKQLENEEVIKNIKHVLDTKVAPNVAMHGGSINYIKFEDGLLHLELAGSCSGCAMSQMTLKMGVENMMKHYVPEVKGLVSQDATKEGDEGYNPWMR